jgi:hypothetical protein
MRLYPIEVRFRRFGDIHLSDLIGAIGVYVIWSSRSVARPTYIGHGTILERFSRHQKRTSFRFPIPWDGYIAIFSGSTPSVLKREAMAAERLLLFLAVHHDFFPAANRNLGCSEAVADFCRHRKLRFRVTGYNPLQPPSEARRLVSPKITDATWQGGRRIGIYNHNWRLRKLRRPRSN